jgi:hypothetical protein
MHGTLDALWTRTFTIRTATLALGMMSMVFALVYVGIGYEQDNMDTYLGRAVRALLLSGVSFYLHDQLVLLHEAIH